MTTWFTADTHFGHTNIIKYTNRPFANAKEMDEALISNWNARVRPEDNVYHLGDFALNTPSECMDVLDRLNGNIHLVRGNHEASAEACSDRFVWVKDYHELLIEDQDAHRGQQSIVLFHYAMRVWNASHHGNWSLFGHSHGTLADDPTSRSIDVGVDVHNLFPISYQEVKDIMAKKNWVSPFAQE